MELGNHNAVFKDGVTTLTCADCGKVLVESAAHVPLMGDIVCCGKIRLPSKETIEAINQENLIAPYRRYKEMWMKLKKYLEVTPSLYTGVLEKMKELQEQEG